mmetsp:Transcript_42529/g.30691  ORF Transcript_42529/g.30691 Transcript_42529/m.30691 type:complete len:96 (-) Transcript_42529:381-668(-)
MFISGFMSTTMAFSAEGPVVFREFSNELYSVRGYSLAKFLIDLPVLLLTPMIYLLVLICFVSLSNSATEFFRIYLIFFMVHFCSASIGTVFSAMI